MGKNESGKSAVMQALWKFNNVCNAKFDRLFDLPAEHFTRLRATDPEVVVLDFTLEPADKVAFLAEFKVLTSAPDAVTVHSTYDGKRTFDVQLNYTAARYSTISGTIQATIPALNTVEQDTADATEKEKLSAAVTALTNLQTAGAPTKTAEEIS